MTEQITIYSAKKIITMSPAQSEGTAVAVKGSKIIAVGSVEELKGWGNTHLDETFKDKILIPGMIEAHSHMLEGVVWMFPYVGYYDRHDPSGKLWKGCKSLEDLIMILKKMDMEMTEPNDPLVAWGFDPLLVGSERLEGFHLDQVSETRPVLVMHASMHLATVNRALMVKENITQDTTTEGVVMGPDGRPNGELRELAAIGLAGGAVMKLFGALNSEEAWQNFGAQAVNGGCTTITDLGVADLGNQMVIDALRQRIDNENYPARVVSAFMAPNEKLSAVTGQDSASDPLEEVINAREQSSDKCRMGIVKLILDGSIQGFTARLRDPLYFNGEPNGLWLSDPEQMRETLLKYHEAGLTVYCHCNGNEAVDVFLDAVEYAQSISYWPDHRHTVQHCQITTHDQYQRMANLGVCANIFAKHIYYWGDKHYEITLGPDRASRMEACRTAKELGVHFTLHGDAAVTPIDQMHSVWCAVNRVTASGRILGEYEKLTVYEALYSVTLDAAYQMKMDHEIGSIEPGKWADFTVLENDPFEVDPMALKEIGIWGTIVGGKPFKAAPRSL